jgi:hypothetical protein
MCNCLHARFNMASPCKGVAIRVSFKARFVLVITVTASAVRRVIITQGHMNDVIVSFHRRRRVLLVRCNVRVIVQGCSGEHRTYFLDAEPASLNYINNFSLATFRTSS